MNDYKNILIIRTDRIGDVVLTTPAIEVIRKNYPKAKITVMVTPLTADLLKGNPFIDDVMIDDRHGVHTGMAGFWRLSSDIHDRRFDAAFIFHTKKRTNFACFNARIPHRIGYKDKNYGFFLTESFPDDRPTGEKHEMQYCLDLLKLAGLRVEHPQILLPYQPEAERWAQDWFAKNNLPENGKTVVIHPGASDHTKCWPASSFGQLAGLLSAEGYKVILIGHGAAVEQAQQIRAKVRGSLLDVTGQTTVAEMASLLKRSHLLISNDSGPVHIASAAGIYVISLFLRDQPGINPQRWRPLGPKGFILANKPEEAVRLNSTGGEIASGLKDSIPVDDVLELANRLLQKP